MRINVDVAIIQPYLDLKAGDNQSLKIQVARPGIEPRSSCSVSQELNHSAVAAPISLAKTRIVLPGDVLIVNKLKALKLQFNYKLLPYSS